jgi:hypothetical protein
MARSIGWSILTAIPASEVVLAGAGVDIARVEAPRATINQSVSFEVRVE